MIEGVNRARCRLGLVLLVLPLGACGTVLHGPTQAVQIVSSPPGATIEVDGRHATTPATIEVTRKPHTVIRASAPGYYDTCKVVEAPIRRGFMATDIIFLAIPLLVDVAAGMDQLRALPPSVDVLMIPATASEENVTLPSDSEIIEAYRRRTDLCAPSKVARTDKPILMTTGDISVPYRVLGTVRVRAKGREGARPARPIFSFRSAGLPAQEPEHEGVADLLQDQALVEFGDQVDALINVSYHGDARTGDVAAEGLAVKFLHQ